MQSSPVHIVVGITEHPAFLLGEKVSRAFAEFFLELGKLLLHLIQAVREKLTFMLDGFLHGGRQQTGILCGTAATQSAIQGQLHRARE